MIGYTTKVSERTSIKKSIIGKHCVIGKMVKIVGCVILDHCIVEDGYGCQLEISLDDAHSDDSAKLDGCILGTNTKVGAKAELSRCVTQAGYEVGAGGKSSNDCHNSAHADVVMQSRSETTSWTCRTGLCTRATAMTRVTMMQVATSLRRLL